MPELPMDVAAANRFISSLSKSLQALCHGCMDFSNGIEIVGYLNVNIDSGSKVDYVLNEKVSKSTTNSMTFVSNSFLAKKDSQKQTRDGACSPIPEFRTSQHTPYRSPYHGPRATMQFSHTYGPRGSQKRPWPGLERDWRAPHKRHRGGRIGYPSFPPSQSHSQSSSTMPSSSASDPTFRVPTASEDATTADSTQSLVNVKKEISESENDTGNQIALPDSEQMSKERDPSDSPNINIKKEPDAGTKSDTQNVGTDNETCDQSADSQGDFKGTFLHPTNNSSGQTDASAEVQTTDTTLSSNAQQSDDLNSDSNPLEQNDGGNFAGPSEGFSESFPSGSGEYDEGGEEESFSQSGFSDVGEGSSETGQFEVIEIEDEDEDVQGLFGDSRNNGKGRKRRYRQVIKPSETAQSYSLEPLSSNEEWSEVCGNQQPSDLSKLSVEICSYCRIALPLGISYKQHFNEVHTSETASGLIGEEFCGYMCEICQKTFITKDRLQQHSSVHDGTLYSCFVCGVQFKHKKNIKRHLESTHGLKKCIVCMCLFNKGEEFDNHVLNCVDSER